MPDSRLKGQLVIITGASAGIGEATAREFASHGADVVLAARRFDRVSALASELSSAHGIKATPVELDVSNAVAVKEKLGAFEADVCVVNAGGVVGMDHADAIPSSAVDSMLGTNAAGALYTAQAVVPGMKARGRGTVIFVGSISGKEVYPGGAVYCGTKHFLNAVARSMRQELLPFGIRVCEIDPGMVETEFSEVRFGGDKTKAKQVYNGVAPLTGQDVAEVIAFMASRPAHVNLADVVVVPQQQATDGPPMVYRKT
ncbi:short-chain dehydrogenase/reductase SDR [Hyaloraphidium curvatum]|nr:short-chain dehydrogenase/reductase SDR [Hyaloraphidium curvatum]